MSPMEQSTRSDVPGVRWPSMATEEDARRLALQFQYAKTERWPESVLEAQQFRQIEMLIAHCYQAAPYWRDRLRQAGLRPGQEINQTVWSRLPILTRAEAQRVGEQLRSDGVPSWHGATYGSATSGSTGIPLQYTKTNLRAVYWFSFSLRIMLWHRVKLDETMAVIKLMRSGEAWSDEGVWYQDWGDDYAPFKTGRAVHLDIRLPPADQIAWLIRENVGYILTFPTNVAALVRYCRAENIRLPNLRGIHIYGESIPDGLRQLCRDIFQIEMVDSYSAEETGLMAMQCPEHAHHHVMSEGMKLEVLDEHDRPCGVGETGRVVVTPLHNLAMPLLRYEVGDFAEVGPACRCGRTLPVLSRILGRSRDRVHMPGGESRLAFWGSQQLYRLPAIIQHQVAQVALDTMEYRLVARRPLTPDEEALLVTMLRDSLGYPFRVRFMYLDAIPRSASGKYQDFRSEIGTNDPAGDTI